MSDCESYGNKKVTVATQQLNITSSQASLHSVSSSQPDVHPFFKVCNEELCNSIVTASVIKVHDFGLDGDLYIPVRSSSFSV
jgi:hypothetical protein